MNSLDYKKNMKGTFLLNFLSIRILYEQKKISLNYKLILLFQHILNPSKYGGPHGSNKWMVLTMANKIITKLFEKIKLLDFTDKQPGHFWLPTKFVMWNNTWKVDLETQRAHKNLREGTVTETTLGWTK